MADLPVPPNPGETVLMDVEAVYPKNSLLGFGYNPVFGHLWLTGQRLIFRGTAFGHILAFPLSHVKGASATQRQIKTSGASVDGTPMFTGSSTVMVVNFDNGGREYFAVKDLAGWSEGIRAAQSKAPPLDYTAMPNRRPGVESSPGQLLLWFGGVVALMCVSLVCCAGLFTFLPVILTLLSGSGGK